MIRRMYSLLSDWNDEKGDNIVHDNPIINKLMRSGPNPTPTLHYHPNVFGCRTDSEE